MKTFLTILFLTFLMSVNAQVINRLIYFNSAKSDLSTVDKSWLDSVSSILRSSEKYSIIIWAYCDADGSEESNLELSMARANSVTEVFLNNKLGKKFIEINSFGENDPTADNNTAEGKAKNRRVKIAITYQKKDQENIVAKTNEIKIVDPAVKTDSTWGKLEIGKTLILKNLNFEGGTAVLLKESEPTLKALLKLMKDNPALEIEIGGHVCCGPDLRLSLARAKKVYTYLLGYGIKSERMAYKGYSYDKPIASDNTEEGKTLNRRVEIRIIKL